MLTTRMAATLVALVCSTGLTLTGVTAQAQDDMLSAEGDASALGDEGAADDDLGASTEDEAPVEAQPQITTSTSADAPDDATEPVEEGVDLTRLDVERLPPEAIEITRDLYSQGFFVDGFIGGRGFVGGIGNISSPGIYANVGFGLEIFRWLAVRVAFEASLHNTDAPAPPSPTAFELMGAYAELRLQANFSAKIALWLGGEIGGVLSFGDTLPVYGVQGADEVGIFYGGTLGLDWHMPNRHTSIGLAGGARHFPSLETLDGSQSIGVHGTLYIRHVI